MCALPAGSVIDGRYEVLGSLGEGGMGVVVAARHVVTGQRVALKMIHPHLAWRPDLAARFLAEARAPAVIGHPGIASVLDAGVANASQPYFVMELLEGESLANLIRRGPMPFEEIRRIAREVLEALSAAHRAGFVHRDLKPDNVFVTAPEGRVKILDFGLAKSLSDLENTDTTQTGTTLGTTSYSSPEQLKNAKRVDSRTDLWSVGVIVYLMLTGVLPYRAETPGEMLLTLLSQPARPLEQSLAHVPPALSAFFARALAVDPAQRFASAEEMARALAELPSFSLAPLPEGARPREAATAPTLAAVLAPTDVPKPVRAAAAPQNWLRPAIAFFAVAALLVLVTLVLTGLSTWYGMASTDTAVRKAAERGEPCALACQRIDACGASFDLGKCRDECNGSEKLRTCVTATDDCDVIGACIIEHSCGKKPDGKASCHAAGACTLSCPLGDHSCICGCLSSVTPSQAGGVVAHESCRKTTCDLDCAGALASREDCLECFAKKCEKQTAVCAGD